MKKYFERYECLKAFVQENREDFKVKFEIFELHFTNRTYWLVTDQPIYCSEDATPPSLPEGEEYSWSDQLYASKVLGEGKDIPFMFFS